MLKSILRRTALIVAAICPLLMPTVTRAESFEILFVFEDSKHTDGSDLVALIEGGYSAGHEAGMTGQILIKKGRKGGRKRDAKYADVLVQDVSRYESSVLIKGLEAHRIESKHTVDLDIPQFTGQELRQRADSYYVAGDWGIARQFYPRALWEDLREDSLELRARYFECKDEVDEYKLRTMTEEDRKAEFLRWPAYSALAWMYIRRGDNRGAAEYHDRILAPGVNEGKVTVLSCQLGGRTGDVYLPPMTEFVPVDICPEMIKQKTPSYPRSAKQVGITGTVWVKSLLGKDGSVIGACVGKSSGYMVLDMAAAEAAYDCKFKPAIHKGEPVACWLIYKVEFSLDG